MEAQRTDTASRVHLHRQRRKSGLAVLSVEISEARWEYVLKHCGLLDHSKADDREAMAEALSRYLALSLIKTEEDIFR